MPLLKKCVLCKLPFETKPFFIKKGQGKYCSPQCQHLGARKGKEVACHVCKKVVYKQKKALERSRSNTFFCGRSCQAQWRNKLYIGDKHKNWKGGMYAYRSVLPRNNVAAVCTLCKIKDKRILAVHHIDHNRKNNKIENLTWLCHNCHHLVHRYPNEHDNLMVAIV